MTIVLSTWVMIMTIGYAQPSTIKADFETKEACELMIETFTAAMKKNWNMNTVVAVCSPKGIGKGKGS